MKSLPGARLRQMAVVLAMFLGLPATIWAAPARQPNNADTDITTGTATATPTPLVITPPLFAPAASPAPAFDTAQAGTTAIGVVTFATTKGATPEARFAFGPKSLNAGIDYSSAQVGAPIRWVLRFMESDINWGDVLPTASAGHADITLERQDKDYLFIGEFEVVFYDGAREITRANFEIYDPDASSSSATVSADNSSSSDNSSDSSDNDSVDNSDDSGDNASSDNSDDSGDNDSSDNDSVDNSDDSGDNESSDNSDDDSDNSSSDNSDDSGDNSDSGDNA